MSWTLVQSAIVWYAALFVVPILLLTLEDRLGIHDEFRFPAQLQVSVALFIAASMLNLATAGFLALRGNGTPLPMACPRELVVTGPYRYVRNPMAVAGIGQGIAVGLFLGSRLVLLYALAGAVLWHVAIRPSEERDLQARFGSSYDQYRRDVPLWWPRWP